MFFLGDTEDTKLCHSDGFTIVQARKPAVLAKDMVETALEEVTVI